MIIFDNCLIQAPDGTNLSRCGRKKVKWYLKYGLADLVCDNPTTIRLKFEPSGRRGLEDPLLLVGKPNICVVCGTTEDLTRHHIIPYCFIRYMDVQFKVDIIRDIFPLCRSCHNIYEKKSQERRHEMAERFGVPINGMKENKLRQIRKAIGAAAALLDHKDKMPPDRREELLDLVRIILDHREITEEDLRAVRARRVAQLDEYINFSQYVAQHVTNYNEFAKEWREHFVETMKPRHMPEAWKIDRITKDVWVPKRILKQSHPC